MKIFDLDGPFQRYGTLVFDIIAVNTLWLVLSLFSFGILQGPALTGLYAGTYSGIVSSEGYTFKEFFRAFRKRFFQSMGIWFLSILIYAVLIVDIYFTLNNLLPGFFTYLIPFFIFMAIEMSFTATFAYPLLANSTTTFKETIKYAFILSNKHLGTAFIATIPNVIIVCIIALAFYGYPQFFPVLFFGMALVGCLNSYLITQKILTQYNFYLAPEGR